MLNSANSGSMLEAQNLSVSFGDLQILDNVSFSVEPGQWLMIAGPNGAGKSTIVNAIAQGVSYQGRILFENHDITGFRPAERAKKFGILAQSHHVGYSYTVEEVVALGRYAWSHGMFGDSLSDNDQLMIEKALDATGMGKIRRQSVLTLSGGELQRTFLAQLFAQDPKLLILDEPANHLDPKYQKQTFELIRSWIKSKDRAVISVVHDLSMARAYGSHTLLINQGKIKACGETETTLSRENLIQVYNMDVVEWINQMLAGWQQ